MRLRAGDSPGELKGKPLKDFAAEIMARLGDDVVDIRSGEILWTPVPFGDPSVQGGTGIGIRYTVPKRP